MGSVARLALALALGHLAARATRSLLASFTNRIETSRHAEVKSAVQQQQRRQFSPGARSLATGNAKMMEGSDSDDASPDMGANLKRAMQYWLDKSTIHIFPRWVAFAVSLALVFLRIYLVQGYFIVAYGLGIFLL
ncbi:hypothetical protein THAOC_19585, partial [Thalassiosira oceanica]